MANATTTKVPSDGLAARIAALTDEGQKLERPFLDFAVNAQRALRDFEAEVARAGIEEDEERLQDAAQPLTSLHNVIEEMTGAYCELLDCLGGDAAEQSPAVAA